MLKDKYIKYIQFADECTKAIKFTEHGVAHATVVSNFTKRILTELGYNEHHQQIGEIAGLLHDIGNIINRKNHAEYGALLARQLLSEDTELSTDDILTIMSTIGNHDEHTGNPINSIAAALIIADKSDVRRSRVRKRDVNTFDIHDRVNYAIYESNLIVCDTTIELKLQLDTEYCSILEYIQIFSSRMELCKKAAMSLNRTFVLIINGVELL